MLKNNLDGRGSRGFIKSIILIIIALALLKYFFGITLRDIASSQVVQDLWAITVSFFKSVWEIILLLLDFLKELIATARDFITGLKH
ncbi:MAG: hypothetical protein V4469_03085 [Patescibacteria group bacterium]